MMTPPERPERSLSRTGTMPRFEPDQLRAQEPPQFKPTADDINSATGIIPAISFPHEGEDPLRDKSRPDEDNVSEQR